MKSTSCERAKSNNSASRSDSVSAPATNLEIARSLRELLSSYILGLQLMQGVPTTRRTSNDFTLVCKFGVHSNGFGRIAALERSGCHFIRGVPGHSPSV